MMNAKSKGVLEHPQTHTAMLVSLLSENNITRNLSVDAKLASYEKVETVSSYLEVAQ